MLHRVTNGGRRGRRRAKVMLRWRHHVVRVRNHRRLTWVVPRVVVGGLARTWAGREGLPGGRIVVDGHRDEVAVFPSRHRGDAERLRPQGGGRRRAFVGVGRRLAVRVVAAVLQRPGRHVDVALGDVRRRHAEPVRDIRHRGQVDSVLAQRRGLGCPHVAVVDVGLEVALRQVGTLAPRNDAAHVEGAPLALLDALHRVHALIQIQPWTHLLSFLLMQQSAVVAEDMFAGDHPSVQLNGETAFVAEVNWNLILFADQI